MVAMTRPSDGNPPWAKIMVGTVATAFENPTLRNFEIVFDGPTAEGLDVYRREALVA